MIHTFKGFYSECEFRQFNFGAQIDWDKYRISHQARLLKIREMDDWLFALIGAAVYVPPAHTYRIVELNENSWAKKHYESWSTYAFMNMQHLIAFKMRFS